MTPVVFKIQQQPDGDMVLTKHGVPMGIFKDLSAAEEAIERILANVNYTYDEVGQLIQ